MEIFSASIAGLSRHERNVSAKYTINSFTVCCLERPEGDIIIMTGQTIIGPIGVVLTSVGDWNIIGKGMTPFDGEALMFWKGLRTR